MQYFAEILRIQEGKRSQNPPFEATVEHAPPGMPLEAGASIAALVDLTPPLSHRSRELRSIVTNTYWHSTGSIVARMRRALAEANRYLVHANEQSAPGNKATGSLTCAVFSEDEMFLGQVGPAYVYYHHPDEGLKLFPRRDHILIPLGGTLPPIIHIGYAPLEENCTLLMATRPIAEVQAREHWQAIMDSQSGQDILKSTLAILEENRTSGSIILAQCTMGDMAEEAHMRAENKSYRLFQRANEMPIPKPATRFALLPRQTYAPPPPTEIIAQPGIPTQEILPEQEEAGIEELLIMEESNTEDRLIDEEEFYAEPEEGEERASLNLQQSIENLQVWWQGLAQRRREHRQATPEEQERLKKALKALLPGQVETEEKEKRQPPEEHKSTMAGLTFAIAFVVFLIVFSTYLQFGGASRAQTMVEQLQEEHQKALQNQTAEDWQAVLSTADQILTLDPQNTEAQAFKKDAQLAIDAVQNAAILAPNPLLDLGTAPSPRRVLVAQSWAYILNTATDEIIGLPLDATGLNASAEAPTPILKRGQTYYGEPVEHLMEMAWVTPGTTYPDGAIFIYSEGGTLYIYEPSLGPASITRQRLQGELQPGTVTLMETYGEQLYLVQRQENQLLKYQPLNGLYDSPPRPYFAEGVAPQLQTALDLAIDGRIYLILGDGTVHPYYDGTEDPGFQVQNLPDPEVQPTTIIVETESEEGRIYLGDPNKERIIVLNKRGEFQHQFRMPDETLRQLEAMDIDEEKGVLYLIAGNRLYAALLPDFANPNNNN